MNYCKDCKHFQIQCCGKKPMCRRSPQGYAIDPVMGLTVAMDTTCIVTRKDETQCGMAARWFEPRVAPIPKAA